MQEGETRSVWSDIPENSMRLVVLDYCVRRYKAEPVRPWEQYPTYIVLRHRASRKWYGIVMNLQRRIPDENGGEDTVRTIDTLTVRCDPKVVDFLTSEPGILPVTYMNHSQWVMILLDGTVPLQRIMQLIDESFYITAGSAANRSAGNAQTSGGNSLSYKDIGSSLLRHSRTDTEAQSGSTSPRTNREAGSSAVRFTSGYSDQSIPRDPERARRVQVPEKIRAMKEVAAAATGAENSPARIFYEQGQFMADYEDDFVYQGNFQRLYPTYSVMTTNQLRGYFGFRTRLRHGSPDREVSTSYVYLYIYELLNGIGVTPEEGYDQLMLVYRFYGEDDARMRQALWDWIPEYVIYYNLSRDLIPRYFGAEREEDLSVIAKALASAPEMVLSEHADLPEDFDRDGVFAAVQALSFQYFEKSIFARKYPEDVRDAVSLILYALQGVMRQQRMGSLVERYFGMKDVREKRLFHSAIFYDHRQYEDYTYEVSPIDVWRCHKGNWTVESYEGGSKRSKPFEQLLREIDRQLRLQFHFGHEIKAGNLDPVTEEIIAHFASQYVRDKEEASRPKISIDMSILGSIRRDAAVTRDSLIVDEAVEDLIRQAGDAVEMSDDMSKDAPSVENIRPAAEHIAEEMWKLPELGKRAVEPDETSRKREAVSSMPAGSDTAPVVGQMEQDSLIFSQEEQFLLHALLYGKAYDDYLRERHLMLSMLVDSINEKAMDAVGDTVIAFDGDVPEVIKDYRGELESLVPERPDDSIQVSPPAGAAKG